jgi:glyoxylase-like metal-dependent hydrolase (beta-lactamase superfamily II)
MRAPSQVAQRLTWLNRFNVYLIETPNGPVLVDGAAPGLFGWLERGLRAAGLTPQDLAALVVTHCHLDHIGTAVQLERLGVPLYALAPEVPILTGTAPAPGYTGAAGRVLALAERVVFGRRTFAQVHGLEPGERLFGSEWEVVGAPGHTPGSLALFNQRSGELLSGDTLVSDFAWPRGPNRLFAADHPRAMASALELLALEPGRILPGHGRPLPAADYQPARRKLVEKLERHRGGVPAR